MSRKKLTPLEMMELPISKFRKLSNADKKRLYESTEWLEFLLAEKELTAENQERDRQKRAELCCGDGDEYRFDIAIAKELNESVSELLDRYSPQQVERYRQAILKQRQDACIWIDGYDWQFLAELFCHADGTALSERAVRSLNGTRPYVRRKAKGNYELDHSHPIVIAKLAELKNNRQ